MPPLVEPLVTLHDLRLFHRKHFPTTPLPCVVGGDGGPGRGYTPCERPACEDEGQEQDHHDETIEAVINLKDSCAEYHKHEDNDRDYCGNHTPGNQLYEEEHTDDLINGGQDQMGQSYDSNYAENDDDNEFYGQDYEDLGVYLDGVQRTLTDEQIAIFRRSEIQALVKKIRTRVAELRGTLQDDQDSGALHAQYDDIAKPDEELHVAETGVQLEKVVDSAETGVQRVEETNLADVGMRQVSALSSPSTSVVPFLESSGVHASAPHPQKKRKGKHKNKRRKLDSTMYERHDKSEYMDESDDEAKTYRRQAREMDEQQRDDITLEY